MAIGQPAVVDNRPDAGGMFGAVAAATTPADGYKLFFSVKATHAIAPNVYKDPKYKPPHDFKAAIRRLAPVFAGFAKNCFDLGRFGNGMKMQLMANLLVAIHNVSTAEALLLGQRWGIKPSTAVKVLSDGAGGSRMLQVRGPQMENEGWKTATMKVGIWQKDMQLIAAALAQAQVPAPLFAASVPVYNAAMALGHAEHDTAAVFDVLSRMASRG